MESKLSKKYSGRMHQDFIIHQQLQPYQVDEASSDVIYLRYESGDEIVYIKKVSTNGTITTMEYAYGLWADRATIVFSAMND